jgi:hypothetical protein
MNKNVNLWIYLTIVSLYASMQIAIAHNQESEFSFDKKKNCSWEVGKTEDKSENLLYYSSYLSLDT